MIVIENGDCSIGTYSNGHIELIKRLESQIPSDNKAGGQSSQRFHRIRENLKRDFRKKIAEFINNKFLFDKNLKGIVLGGTFVTVDEFNNSKEINHQLRNKIICKQNISSDGFKGLEELYNKSLNEIADNERIDVENMVEKFFKTLAVDPNKVVYGNLDIDQMIKENRFENKIIIDKDVSRYYEIEGLGGTVGFLYF